MSSLSTSQVYTSTNHHKHTHSNRFYQWHLQEVMGCLYDVIAATEPRNVLDAGCGEGYVLDFISRRNPDLKLVGVDLSEQAVQYAKEHFGQRAEFRKGSVYKLPFSDKSFDTVVCSEVLEHLDDAGRAIAELRRVARKAVVITVPREPYFQWLNNAAQWLGISPDPEHVNFWDKGGFEAFIRSHFEDVTFASKHIYLMASARL
jgi:ubiquinone/menaquinone biosynthesis C-methylase UbiE